MSIERQFRSVLAEMEVWLSYGTVINLGAGARGGDGSSGRPPGSEFPMHLEWRSRWERAFNKRRCLDDATKALAAARKQKQVVAIPETQSQLEARIIKEGVGWSVKDVANHCRCTEKQVRRARLKGGVDTDDGKGASLIAFSEGQEHARQLADRGMTERQIAMITKLPKTSVRRALGRAA